MLSSSAVFNSIEKNHLHEHRVSEPMVKALVRGLASSSACTTTGDLSGCQVARVKRTRVWSLIYFLNMFKGKVVHFFRPTFPNPLPMLWMLIWGLFPIGPRLEHLHWIGSIGGVAGMPMLCQFQTMHYQSPAN